MSSPSANRFVPSLESLGERLNPGALAAAGALPDATHHEWVFGVELPRAGSETRVSSFPSADRGSPGSDGVVILYSSLPGGGADAHEPPHPTILHQRLANPSLPDAAAREVRHRTFAIVDRTQLGDGESARGGSSGTHVLYQDVFIPAGRASGDIVLKGSKIGENAPIDVDDVAAAGESEALRRRTLVTTLSADLDRPGTAP